ncbi:hypothetical protein [Anaeromassilibacillus sp. SJQ-1]|uniref:hypothetical protein n=1 Tax=Anaeromassilibacillus sp. SJQ-1 TaxID=3375419 RepID=UPI0039891096
MGRYERRALRGVSSDFKVISRDCIAQSNAKGLGFERHRADCGASIEKGRGKPGFWDAASGGPCGTLKTNKSAFVRFLKDRLRCKNRAVPYVETARLVIV